MAEPGKTLETLLGGRQLRHQSAFTPVHDEVARIPRVRGDNDVKAASGSISDVAELGRQRGPQVETTTCERCPASVDEGRDLPAVARGCLCRDRAAVEQRDADIASR